MRVERGLERFNQVGTVTIRHLDLKSKCGLPVCHQMTQLKHSGWRRRRTDN